MSSDEGCGVQYGDVHIHAAIGRHLLSINAQRS